jgi:hypothetical protein
MASLNYELKSSTLPFASILRKVRRQKAIDPRDKVYAAFGMAPLSKQGHPLLQPNYGLSKADVFIQTSYYLLLKYRNLNIFLAKTLALDLSPFNPSWVVD